MVCQKINLFPFSAFSDKFSWRATQLSVGDTAINEHKIMPLKRPIIITFRIIAKQFWSKTLGEFMYNYRYSDFNSGHKCP